MACFNSTRFIVLLLSLIMLLAVSSTRLQDFSRQQLLELKKTLHLICLSQTQSGVELSIAASTWLTGQEWPLAEVWPPDVRSGSASLELLTRGCLRGAVGKALVLHIEGWWERGLCPRVVESCKLVCCPCTAGRHYVTSFISAGSPGFHRVA